MSYGNAPQKRGSGRGPILLIIIGFGLFMLFSNRGAIQSPAQPGGGRDWGEPADNYPEFESVPQQAEKHPEASDWEMEEVKSTSKQAPVVNPDSESKRTKSGDWSMEEVETSEARKKVEFNISNQTTQPKPSSKSTKKGDWEIEEVDKKN